MWLAHGVGGRQDLPIPFGYAVAGALIALVVSFVALGLLWRQPRLGGRFGEALPRIFQPRRPWILRILGLVLTAYFLIGFLGRDTANNPVPGVVYVLFWVGLLPLSVLFGPVWRDLNPLRTVHLLACRALRRDPEAGWRELPPRLGYRPAALGLLAFVWLELTAPHRTSLPTLATWLAAYAAAMWIAAAVFGSRWFDEGDAFEAYGTVVGSMAPTTRTDGGTLVWRHPFDGLADLRPRPGLVAFVVVLLGSTMYDSVSNAPFWVQIVQGGRLPVPLLAATGLVVVIALVYAIYQLCTGLAAHLGGRKRSEVAVGLAHSLVPIAAGYLVAHYFTLFLLEGQRTLALLSDPLTIGANWLGTANWTVQAFGTTPAGIALLQVTVIVIGHIFGTVLAHDRALRLFDRRTAVAGQVPLLVMMVLYTAAGLLLLFAA